MKITANPQLVTRNSQPATRNSQPATRNPQPATRNPQPATRNPHSASALPGSPYGQRSRDDNHKLVTVYKLEYDTRDTITVWSSYSSFLNNNSAAKHISADGAGELALSVTVPNDSGAIGDSGEHSAALTLTACWKS